MLGCPAPCAGFGGPVTTWSRLGPIEPLELLELTGHPTASLMMKTIEIVAPNNRSKVGLISTHCVKPEAGP